MSVSDPFGKYGLALVSIPYIFSFPFKMIFLLIHLHLLFLISSLLILESKKPIIKIKKDNYVDSDIKMQPLSSQQSLQPTLQTLQEDSELRRFKHQTQIPLKKEIFIENKNILLIFCRILYGTQS